MNQKPDPDSWNDIDTALYNRSVKVFNTLKKMLSVKMTLHAEDTQVQQGDIFLFNHFSRFETFIPQFFIFEETGAYSCAIASAEFFIEDNVLSRYLKNVGVFPHNHARLFPLLAAQVLRGRKVIIFPEGGMVKDHHVIDKYGHYSVYSRLTGERRKHHSGAAVLAQGIEVFKAAILNAYDTKNYAQQLRWKEDLQLDSLDHLLVSALKPTLIIPSNITFYPIRSSANILLSGVELFGKGLSLRQTEELLVEGNILFKNTDMDIRMGTPIIPFKSWNWRIRFLLNRVMSEFKTLDDIFALNSAPKNWKQKLLGSYFKNAAIATRDQYMQEIYANVTINLSHLASTLIMYCIENDQPQIKRRCFFTTLYIAVKHLQNHTHINLHRSLLNPIDYSDLATGTSKRFEQFVSEAKTSGLITDRGDSYQFLPKLLQEHDLDKIRLENMIAVYDNEAEPIKLVRDTLIQALAECDGIDQRKLAVWHFDDECRDLSWERHAYSKPIYDDINEQETAAADSSPFFLEPKQGNGLGILLIHGLLASPAELRAYGEYLVQLGYTVMGVRLKGHGSSPYALRDQSREDWYASVLRGFNILKAHCERMFVTGFSTGGALALKLASEQHPEIIGVIAVAVPLKFINSAFMLVPLLHGTNKLVDWVSSYEGIKPFIENISEHPWVNYRNTPVKCLYELRLLIQHMDEFLPKIVIPVLILHGDHDPVVAFKSALELMNKLKTPNKQLKIINSNRHGILMENIGGTWDAINEFMDNCLKETKAVKPGNETNHAYPGLIKIN
ncbi:Alpha/beta hydrolase [Candidatus Methylobacter favarea]|uniref:Alpha/beta hydrolase n=1 Tax=Candidatus Methylobacter favarea TaxID=2707345 RepID=A0A8S0XH78_9GAMM|nr:alpha/beta fold hydrolase [Candidatus Methylobacter favarea]CAA9891591.1 Alpha/beta hydrolase [Candidatus Methylobacter favarea]